MNPSPYKIKKRIKYTKLEIHRLVKSKFNLIAITSDQEIIKLKPRLSGIKNDRYREANFKIKFFYS